MNLYIIVNGGAGSEGDTWIFRDDEYLEALTMYRNMGRNRDKGLLLQDGEDGVWLEKELAGTVGTMNYQDFWTWASLKKIFGA